MGGGGPPQQTVNNIRRRPSDALDKPVGSYWEIPEEDRPKSIGRFNIIPMFNEQGVNEIEENWPQPVQFDEDDLRFVVEGLDDPDDRLVELARKRVEDPVENAVEDAVEDVVNNTNLQKENLQEKKIKELKQKQLEMMEEVKRKLNANAAILMKTMGYDDDYYFSDEFMFGGGDGPPLDDTLKDEAPPKNEQPPKDKQPQNAAPTAHTKVTTGGVGGDNPPKYVPPKLLHMVEQELLTEQKQKEDEAALAKWGKTVEEVEQNVINYNKLAEQHALRWQQKQKQTHLQKKRDHKRKATEEGGFTPLAPQVRSE